MSDVSVVALSITLFEDILLNFVLSCLIVIDDSYNFKGIIGELYVSLKLPVQLLTKYNAKDLYMEHCRRVLDTTVTVASEYRDRQRPNFVAVVVATIFVWDNVPINRTDIIRSIVGIGRPLMFSIDVEMNKIPSSI